MKASLETVVTNENQGVVLESETPDEARVLERLWTHKGRAMSFEKKGEEVELTIAPKSEQEVNSEDY
jgi:hypothetical protein